MSVAINSETFAKLAGAYPERNVLLFEVAAEFVDNGDDNSWSDPVIYRFVRRKGAVVELEIHKLDPVHLTEAYHELVEAERA